MAAAQSKAFFPGIRGAAIAVALYVLLSAILATLNQPVFLAVNGANNAFLDGFLGLVSGLGDGLIVALICTGVMLWRFRLGLAGVLAFLASGLIAQLLKRLVDAPRPAAVFDQVHVLGDALHAHSFPSGHATSLGVLIPLALYLFGSKDWRCWLLGIFSLMAAYGRVYGGVHFPLDVWVGLGLGVACMWGIWQWIRIQPEWDWEQSIWAWNVPAVLLMGEAGVLGLGYHMQPLTAQPLAWIAAVAALAYLIRMWRQLRMRREYGH